VLRWTGWCFSDDIVPDGKIVFAVDLVHPGASYLLRVVVLDENLDGYWIPRMRLKCFDVGVALGSVRDIGCFYEHDLVPCDSGVVVSESVRGVAVDYLGRWMSGELGESWGGGWGEGLGLGKIG